MNLAAGKLNQSSEVRGVEMIVASTRSSIPLQRFDSRTKQGTRCFHAARSCRQILPPRQACVSLSPYVNASGRRTFEEAGGGICSVERAREREREREREKQREIVESHIHGPKKERRPDEGWGLVDRGCPQLK